MNILPFHYLFCFADINQVVLATNAFMIYLFVYLLFLWTAMVTLNCHYLCFYIMSTAIQMSLVNNIWQYTLYIYIV